MVARLIVSLFSFTLLLSSVSAQTPKDSPAASTSVDWSGFVVKAFESLGSNLSGIQTKTANYSSAGEWRSASNWDVALVGGGACVVPLAGAAVLPAEFGYLMRQVYNSAMGMGFLVNGSANRDDFANILAMWTDEMKMDHETLQQAFDLAEQIAKNLPENSTDAQIQRSVDRVLAMGQLATGLSGGVKGHAALSQHAMTLVWNGGIGSRVLSHKAGAKAAGKLSAKVAAKAGAKIGGKYATKVATIWVPALSAVVCAGLNAWIMDGVLASADTYYNRLKQFREQRYSRLPTSRRN